MERQVIITLLQKHFSATAREEETAALMQWLSQVQAAEFDEVIESFPNAYAKLKTMDLQFARTLEAKVDAIEAEEKEEEDVTEQLAVPRVHRVHFLKRSWWKYAAAIIILF